MKLSREQHKFIKKQKKDKESVIRPLVPQVGSSVCFTSAPVQTFTLMALL